MSNNDQDSMILAQQAERALNSNQAKIGSGRVSDSALESGVDEAAETRFPGAHATYGSAASGAGDNRDIPESEGGGEIKVGGVTRQAKAGDFEGLGGPEDKEEQARSERGGNDAISGNVRQGGGGNGSVRVPGGK